MKKLARRVMGEFQVTGIAKSRVTDVFEYPDADTFFNCKVVYMAADADSGKEKKISNLMMVTASDVKQAYERIRESLNNMLVTFTIPEVKESPVLEIFHHTTEQKVPEGFKPVSEVAVVTEEEEDDEEI